MSKSSNLTKARLYFGIVERWFIERRRVSFVTFDISKPRTIPVYIADFVEYFWPHLAGTHRAYISAHTFFSKGSSDVTFESTCRTGASCCLCCSGFQKHKIAPRIRLSRQANEPCTRSQASILICVLSIPIEIQSFILKHDFIYQVRITKTEDRGILQDVRKSHQNATFGWACCNALGSRLLRQNTCVLSPGWS